MRAPAGIEWPSGGSWDCGTSGGSWSAGECGCGSGGSSCECDGSCGCGGCGKGGNSATPRIPNYDGEIWAPTLDVANRRGEGVTGSGELGAFVLSYVQTHREEQAGSGQPEIGNEWFHSVSTDWFHDGLGWVNTIEYLMVGEVCCCVPALNRFLCGRDVGGGRIYRSPSLYSSDTGTFYCGDDSDCLAFPLPGPRPRRTRPGIECPEHCLATALRLQIQCLRGDPACEANLGMYNFMCKAVYPMCPDIYVPPAARPRRLGRDCFDAAEEISEEDRPNADKRAHCYLMCCMMVQSDHNEIVARNMRLVGALRELWQQLTGANTPEEGLADLEANRAGFTCAKTAKDEIDCENCCEGSYPG